MNDTIRDVMCGRRGVAAALARTALSVGAVGYGATMRRRNARYDRGVGVHRAHIPVVSVGNLTAGGTGKTPVVALLANRFRDRGATPTLLSRGYRATAGRPNDEALVLEHLCPGVPHLQTPDRVAAAAEAATRFGASVLILDDGFQHRRLARDLDIVLIDATNPFGYGHLLPRGLLREPIESLRRADLVLLTRADAVAEEAKRAIHRRLDQAAPGLPIVEITFPPVELVNTSGERRPLASLEEKPLLAFCGIGNPAGFARTLSTAGLRPAEVVAFPDHHPYDQADLDRLARRAHALGIDAAVTTLKDLVKIRTDTLPVPAGIPVWAIETGCEIVTNGPALFERLDALVGPTAGRRAA
jgi:tetraacyldisaccharide 4'-kinase